MNANTLFPLATIALLAVGIARGALCAPEPGQTYGAGADISEERCIGAHRSAPSVEASFAPTQSGLPKS